VGAASFCLGGAGGEEGSSLALLEGGEGAGREGRAGLALRGEGGVRSQRSDGGRSGGVDMMVVRKQEAGCSPLLHIEHFILELLTYFVHFKHMCNV
jgi:hypothetical protein